MHICREDNMSVLCDHWPWIRSHGITHRHLHTKFRSNHTNFLRTDGWAQL